MSKMRHHDQDEVWCMRKETIVIANLEILEKESEFSEVLRVLRYKVPSAPAAFYLRAIAFQKQIEFVPQYSWIDHVQDHVGGLKKLSVSSGIGMRGGSIV